LQHQAVTDWQKVFDFVIKYQDRLLYGTDLSDNGTEDPSELKKHAHEVRLRHWRFFTSDESMEVPKVDGAFKGLHLPREVVDKIYRRNAEKWFPGLVKNKV
jgi:predicted TIM-barrel fold metal-dependent hydrolase